MTIECGCPGSAKRLLLVAYNQNFRRTLERILCRCGYTVEGAASGEDALRRLEQSAYDAIISEVFLPGSVCGLTVLDRVRRHHPNLPIILLAEGTTTRVRSALNRCEGVECLPLPIDVDQLKRVIAATTQDPLVA
jgi:DNA-binding NtrC family response regulator